MDNECMPAVGEDVTHELTRLVILSDVDRTLNLLSSAGAARETGINGTSAIIAGASWTFTFVPGLGFYGLLIDALIESNAVTVSTVISYDGIPIFTIPVTRSDPVIMPNRWSAFRTALTITFTNAGPGAATVNFQGRVTEIGADVWADIQQVISGSVGRLLT